MLPSMQNLIVSGDSDEIHMVHCTSLEIIKSFKLSNDWISSLFICHQCRIIKAYLENDLIY